MKQKQQEKTVQNKEFFEGWSPEKFGMDLEYQKNLRAFSSPYINGDVLDFGCGARVYYDLRQARSWTGLDISQKMVSDIQFCDDISHLKTNMMIDDIVTADLPANSYDTICAFFILHHLGAVNKKQSMERVTKTLEKSYQALRKGGVMVIAENAAEFLEWPYHALYPLLYKPAKKWLDTELPYFYTKRQMRTMLGKAGFQDVALCHFKIEDWIYNPVLRCQIPPLLGGSWIQTMTLYICRK